MSSYELILEPSWLVSERDGKPVVVFEESEAFLEVRVDYPGLRAPVWWKVVGGAALCLLPLALPDTLEGSGRWLWVCWEAAMVLMVGRVLVMAYTRVNLRLDDHTASMAVATPVRVSKLSCPLAELKVCVLDYDGSEEGGHDAAPLHYLPLEFGNREARVLYGHSERDLFIIQQRLLTWIAKASDRRRATRGTE